MKTVEFLNLLREFPNKTIRFAYAPSQFVKQGYHITEVKHLTIDTVDCGGRSHFWKETIIQLWEDPSNTDTSYMSAFKALSILKKVAKTKPFVQEATLKFEYGNTHFHTAQLAVEDVNITDTDITILLYAEATDCKAKDVCGVKEEPVLASVSENTCAPGSGCC